MSANPFVVIPAIGFELAAHSLAHEIERADPHAATELAMLIANRMKTDNRRRRTVRPVEHVTDTGDKSNG